MALVRFGDGTVKVANYHGTSDLLVPRLFDTAMAATDAYFEGRDGWSEPEGDVEDVVVYVDYGDSFWYEAKATRTSVLPEYCGPLDASSEDEMGRRDPSRGLVEVHNGEPDWATESFRSRTDIGLTRYSLRSNLVAGLAKSGADRQSVTLDL